MDRPVIRLETVEASTLIEAVQQVAAEHGTHWYFADVPEWETETRPARIVVVVETES